MNTETLATTGMILDGDAGNIARINRITSLLNDIRHGIAVGADRQHMAEDARRALGELKTLIEEMGKWQ